MDVGQSQPNCEVNVERTVEQVCADAECAHLAVCQDTTAPQITLSSATLTNSPDYTLRGEIAHDGDLASASYTLGESAAQPLEVRDGQFEAPLTLDEGDNHLEITATDEIGNQGKLQATLRFELPARELYANFTVGGTFQVNEPIHVDASPSVLPRETSAEYFWDFGDGTTGRGEFTNHVYASPGIYVVTLRVVTEADEESIHIDNVEIEGRQLSAATGQLEGMVVNAAGEPIEAAAVSLDELGLEDASTGSGHFGFTEVPVNEALALTVTHPAYVERVIRVEVSATSAERFVRVELAAPAEPQTGDDASQDTSVSGADGAGVEVSGGSLTDADGQPVSGSFEVVVTPLDVVGFPGRLPGGTAALLSDGSTTELQAAGAVHVAFYQDGEPLLVAPGRTVSVHIPMYAELAQQGEAIPSFELNSSSGLWLEQPAAVVESAPDAPTSTVATIDISRAGWWLVGEEVAPDLAISARCTHPAGTGGSSSGADAGSNQDAGATSDTGQAADAGVAGDEELCWVEAQADGWSHYFGAPVDDVYDFDAPTGEVCLTALARGGLCHGEACVTGSAGDSLSVDVEMNCIDDGAQPTSFGETVDDIAFDDTTTQQVFGFDGAAGEGIIFRMRQDHPEQLAGKLRLYAATGTLLTAIPYGVGEDEALAAILPEDGRYFATVAVENGASGSVSTRLVRREVLGVGDRADGLITYGDEYTYLVDARNETLLNGLFRGNLAQDTNLTQLYWLDLFGNRQAAGPRSTNRESGLFDVSSRRFHQLRLEMSNFGDFNARPFEVTVGRTDAPTALSFDGMGHAVAHDALERFADHRFFEFDADQGDGLYIVLQGRGSTTTESAQLLGMRLWYVGSGSFWNGEERLYLFNRNAGVLGAMDALAIRAPHTGKYALEVFSYVERPNGVELGKFQVSVDKVDRSANITVGDSSCAGATTRSFSAATRAIEANGTVTVCEGTYSSLAKGLIDRDDVTVVGAGPTQSTLRYTHPLYRDDGRVALAVDALNVTIENLGITYYLPPEQRDNGRAFISDRQGSNHRGVSSGTHISNVRLQVDTAHRGVNNGLYFAGDRGAGTSDIIVEQVTVSGASTGISLEGDHFDVRDTMLDTRGTGVRFNWEEISHAHGSSLSVTNTQINAGGRGIWVNYGGDLTLRDNVIMSHDSSLLLWLNRPGPSTTVVTNNTLTATDTASVVQVTQYEQADTSVRTVEISDNDISGDQRLTHGAVQIRSRDAQAQFDIARNRIDTAGDQGLLLSIPANNKRGGTVRVANNLVLDVSQSKSAIDIQDAEWFDGIKLSNNSVRSRTNSSYWGPHVGVRVRPEDTAFAGALPVVVRNNIFQGPTDTSSQQHVGVELVTSNAVTIDSDHNLFYGFATAYSGGGQTAGANDITDQDPQFTDAQLHVDPTSPAVDAGTCTDAPATDRDGNSRPQGGLCDIGAYEQ